MPTMRKQDAIDRVESLLVQIKKMKGGEKIFIAYVDAEMLCDGAISGEPTKDEAEEVINRMEDVDFDTWLLDTADEILDDMRSSH